MKMEKLFLFFVIAFIASARGSTVIEEFDHGVRTRLTVMDFPRGETHYTGIFNRATNMYTLQTSTLNSTHMQFEITGATAGWVGLILNPARAALDKGDVVIAGVHGDTQQPYYTDMYGDPGLTADNRTESDWILVSADETGSGTGTVTSIVFHRQYDTMDPNIGQDYLITEAESVYYVAIMGQIDDPFPTFVSSDAVGTSQVNFVGGGRGGGGGGGNGAYGLTGSFKFIITLASIAALKAF